MRKMLHNKKANTYIVVGLIIMGTILDYIGGSPAQPTVTIQEMNIPEYENPVIRVDIPFSGAHDTTTTRLVLEALNQWVEKHQTYDMDREIDSMKYADSQGNASRYFLTKPRA